MPFFGALIGIVHESEKGMETDAQIISYLGFEAHGGQNIFILLQILFVAKAEIHMKKCDSLSLDNDVGKTPLGIAS